MPMGRYDTSNSRRWATAGPPSLALTAGGGNDDDDDAGEKRDLAATVTAGAPTAGGDMIATEEIKLPSKLPAAARPASTSASST